MATLSHNPRSLIELWREFQFGVDGRKPASHFTTRERNNRTGGIKQKFYRRKIIWDTVSHLVRSGFTAEGAIAKIRQVYGQHTSVGKIIQNICCDCHIYNESGGYHPNLV